MILNTGKISVKGTHHETVLQDERNPVTDVVVLTLARRLSNETGHSLLGNGAQQMIVENNLIPGNLLLALGDANRQHHAGRPQILILDDCIWESDRG